VFCSFDVKNGAGPISLTPVILCVEIFRNPNNDGEVYFHSGFAS
jgi:hypothetical protein